MCNEIVLMKKFTRWQSIIICTLVYILCMGVAWKFAQVYRFGFHPLVLMLVADVIATLIVYVFSLLYKNSSLYDPYWSVIPPAIALFWAWHFDVLSAMPILLMLVGIGVWATRLTLNWLRGWQGLSHQDWRYAMLHDRNPKLYWLTNFGGIHMFPTLIVFAGMLPVYYFIQAYANIEGNLMLPVVILGFALTIAAALIELVADEQMRSFKKRAKAGEHIDEGLWHYSRHPNYFGEVTFWFGLWVMLMGIAPQYWWTGIGWLAMAAMFVFASIPMMEEKNLKSKPSYQGYIDKVSMLLPWIRKK